MDVIRQIKTIQEIKLAKTQSTISAQQADLLDAQDVTVSLSEQIAEKDQQILDLQELVVNLNEKIEKIGGGQ